MFTEVRSDENYNFEEGENNPEVTYCSFTWIVCIETSHAECIKAYLWKERLFAEEF